MQQGQESIEYIKILEDDLCKNNKLLYDYKKTIGLLLKAQAYVEMGLFTEVKAIIFYLYNHRKSIFNDRRILWCKYKSIRAKYTIELIKNNIINKNKIYRALSLCKSLYYDTQRKHETSEQIQAAIYWLESFKQLDLDKAFIKIEKDKRVKRCLKNSTIFKCGSAKEEYCFVQSTIGLLFNILNLIVSSLKKKEYINVNNMETDNEQWIPKREEVIKLLSECLTKFDAFIYNLEHKEYKELKKIYDTYKEKEKEFCEMMLDGFGNKKPSCYHKVKFQRKIQILNLKSSRENKDFKFPEDVEIKKVIKFVRNEINPDYYMRQLCFNTEKFDEQLIYHSYLPHLRNSYALTILRKWQSYTPSLGSYSSTSRGGGYFLYKVGNEGYLKEGIVIDPGYDFIENFIEQKFSIIDINAIIFTHSHIDHSDDFRGLMTLMHELNSRANKKIYKWKPHKIRIVLTPSCFDIYYQILNDCRDYIEDVVVVDDPCIFERTNENNLSNKYQINFKEFSINALPAYHEEINDDANCVGFVINNIESKPLVGFTGDTVWTRTLVNKLKNCTVLCVNMGSLLNVRKGHSFKETYLNTDAIRKLIYEQNHLYLPGILTILNELAKYSFKGITVVGELGEELKSGLREDLFYKFNEFINPRFLLSNNSSFLVALEDIGLTIAWDNDLKPQIRCMRCKRSINESINLKVNQDLRGDEQLNYYCKDCISSLEAMEIGVEENWQRRYLQPQ